MDLTIAGTWLVIALALFAGLRPRRALLVTFVVGWLFLPVDRRLMGHLPGLPDLTKANVVSASAMLGMLLFDAGSLRQFRLRWIDLPVVGWCLVPMISSLTNGLGAYDGFSAVEASLTSWGIPYLLGRIYFRDADALRDLAIAIVVGGLAYLPLCVWEIRMSPQLHKQFFGYHSHQFSTNVRYGGFRPSVFMHSALMVGMWMSSAAICALWLTRARSVRSFALIPRAWATPALILVALACKVVGAISLLLVGAAALFSGSRFRLAAPLLLFASLVALYPFMRLSGILPTEACVGVVSQVYDAERTRSMSVRFENEDQLAARALERPAFGWGRWGRSRIRDERTGKDVSRTDGKWIIALGESGLVGLTMLLGVLTIPVFAAVRRVSPRLWLHPKYAPVAALCVVAAMYGADNLVNAMLNPVFILALGGLAGVLYWPRGSRRRVVTPRAGASSLPVALAAPGATTPRSEAPSAGQ